MVDAVSSAANAGWVGRARLTMCEPPTGPRRSNPAAISPLAKQDQRMCWSAVLQAEEAVPGGEGTQYPPEESHG